MARDGASRSSQVQGNHRGRDWLGAVVSGIFAGAQQEYAEHRIAAFPVGTDKRPAITNYQRVGLRASEALAARSAVCSKRALAETVPGLEGKNVGTPSYCVGVIWRTGWRGPFFYDDASISNSAEL
jgi:hypothetical protein